MQLSLIHRTKILTFCNSFSNLIPNKTHLIKLLTEMYLLIRVHNVDYNIYWCKNISNVKNALSMMNAVLSLQIMR